MSINSDLYYTYKRRFEEVQEALKRNRGGDITLIYCYISDLENLAKELLNDLASERLSSSQEPRFEKKEYEKEVGITRD